MIEVKALIDPVRKNSYRSERKIIYTGIGQLMFHGRARYGPELPVSLCIGASWYDEALAKPILTFTRTPVGESLEGVIRENLEILGVSLILCAKVNNVYTFFGDDVFEQRMEHYMITLALHERERLRLLRVPSITS